MLYLDFLSVKEDMLLRVPQQPQLVGKRMRRLLFSVLRKHDVHLLLLGQRLMNVSQRMMTLILNRLYH